MFNNYFNKLTLYLPKIFVAILLLIIGWITSHIFYRILEKFFKKTKIDSLVEKYIQKTISTGILILFGILALAHLGLNIGPFLVSLGAGGLIIGFGIRNIISDFANGLMILVYRPFKNKDYIKVSGIEGIVENISIVNIQLSTIDGKIVFIPNRNVWGQNIVNFTNSPYRIIEINLSFLENKENIEDVLKEVLIKNNYTDFSIYTSGIINNSLQYKIQIKTKPSETEKIAEQLPKFFYDNLKDICQITSLSITK